MSIPSLDIERARETNILAVLERRGIAFKRASSTEWAGPCPRCGGVDRFSINSRKQIFNCRGCGACGDVIALVQHVDGCDFQTAVEKLCGSLINDRRRLPRNGEPYIIRDKPEAASDAVDEADRLLRAAAIWDEAKPIDGTDGEGYLVGRGIMLDDVPDGGGLRWQPACRWETGTAPCTIARYTDAVTAEPRGIWRRPLTGEKPKALGPTKGCVIRLWPDDAVERGLVLGEGVETTLAAATRITHHGAYLHPAWAAGFAGNMAAFPALSGIEALTLLVDHDANGRGQLAAIECASRWTDAGKEVTRLTPGECGVDFNDLVKP
jgi:phage/plasmid primase-like uncharacterized protein